MHERVIAWPEATLNSAFNDCVCPPVCPQQASIISNRAVSTTPGMLLDDIGHWWRWLRATDGWDLGQLRTALVV